MNRTKKLAIMIAAGWCLCTLGSSARAQRLLDPAIFPTAYGASLDDSRLSPKPPPSASPRDASPRPLPQLESTPLRQPESIRSLLMSEPITESTCTCSSQVYPTNAIIETTPCPSCITKANQLGNEVFSPIPELQQPRACRLCGGLDATCSLCKQPKRYIQRQPLGVAWRGWLNGGMTFNPDSPPSGFNGPVGLNDRDSELLLNQAYLIGERAIDLRTNSGWNHGGRVDLLFGSDARALKSRGWELHDNGLDHWNTPGSRHQFAIPQLYAEAAYDRASVKLGHFYTLLGYESAAAPENFFQSHSYGFMNAAPFTHWGALGTWQAQDGVTLYGGLVNGWDALDRLFNSVSFLGGIRYTPWHERFSLAYTLLTGKEGTLADPSFNLTEHSFIFDWTVTERWQYVLSHDAGWATDFVGGDQQWYGLTNYLFYELNPCWKLGGRVEWFHDADGVRVAGFDVTNPYLGGSPGDFWEISTGLNWTPSPNLLVRPELRWDTYEGGGLAPYNDGASTSQFLAGCDVVWQF